MKRRAFVATVLASALTLGAPFTPAAAATATQLRALTVVADDSGAAVSFGLSARTAYHVVAAKNPSRIAVTLHHVRALPSLTVPQPQGVVAGITAQPQPGGDLRVTVFLSRPLPAYFHWSRGHRSTPALLAQISRGARMHAGSAAAAPATTDTGPRAVQASHAPRQSGRDIVVAVDAGHGGEDPGATGHAGIHEKDVVLAIARALAARINGAPGMRAVLTRDRDEFLTLRDRIRRARVAKADLFVSVHADSIANSTVSGSSVYVLSEHGATNEAARWLAEREIAADLMGGVSLGDKNKTLASVLLDLSQSANISASTTAAQSVLGALEGVGLVRKPEVQQAGFVVLKSPDIPSMLIETAYISNPAEERRLRTPAQQAALADAIFAGLRTYFNDSPPAGTRLAAARGAESPAVLAGVGSPGD